MPRYVILTHDHPRGRHWDFMLEQGESLATWALGQPPDAAPRMPAEALPDHRPAYLDHEGPVSGGRGSVTRWDQGTYRLERHDDDRLIAIVTGQRLSGQVILERTAADPQRWIFSFSPD